MNFLPTIPLPFDTGPSRSSTACRVKISMHPGPQTAKYGWQVDEAHRPKFKIRTSTSSRGGKSAPIWVASLKKPHRIKNISFNPHRAKNTSFNPHRSQLMIQAVSLRSPSHGSEKFTPNYRKINKL